MWGSCMLVWVDLMNLKEWKGIRVKVLEPVGWEDDLEAALHLLR
jgi:hypothetical protein